jgi:hypothetical protein
MSFRYAIGTHGAQSTNVSTGTLSLVALPQSELVEVHTLPCSLYQKLCSVTLLRTSRLLYQGHLNSRDIEEALDDPGDFGLHIAQVLVFADKRNIRELEDDAISMLLSYLNKTGLATLEAINCIYDMPESAKISNLRKFLAQDEVWFGRRLKKKIAHWHPEFMAKIIEIYQMDEPKPSRVLETFVTTLSALLCKHLHEHTTEEPSCSSLVRNIYLAPSPPARERPNKKRKIIQTVEVLDD